MTDLSINPDGTRTFPPPLVVPEPEPRDEVWFAEAKRLNDLLVELQPKPCSPGKERSEDTPADVLGILRGQQERHLGGLAKPARGFLPGTLVQPHGRRRDSQLGEWTPLVVAAIERHRQFGDGDQFPVFLENREARRAWRKLNPFRRVKQRIKRCDVVGPGEYQVQEGAQRRFMEEDGGP